MRIRLWGDFMTANNPFFERKFDCPVCKTKFTSLAVRSSRVYVERKEEDFHVIYRGVSPLHYSIIVCPACYYAASTNGFSKEIKPALHEKLLQALYQLRPKSAIKYNQERDLQKALDSFKLAVRSAQLKQVPAGELAGLFMGAAWMAREADNQELESVYLKEALDHYLEAYNKDFQSIGNMSDLQATYLIGELYRRNGNNKEAVNWFNRVIVHKYIKQNPQIEKLARDQWALAREQAQLQPDSESGTVAAIQPEEKPKKEANTAPASTTRKITPPRRSSMQMLANLYLDQIDWLTGIVNNGYNSTKTLVSKEQVLRALLDAVIINLDNNLPQQFDNEEELKDLFSELLTGK
jgi:uncharacterized protein (DUF2225 family)